MSCIRFFPFLRNSSLMETMIIHLLIPSAIRIIHMFIPSAIK